jgi:hypothetical protein
MNHKKVEGGNSYSFPLTEVKNEPKNRDIYVCSGVAVLRRWCISASRNESRSNAALLWPLSRRLVRILVLFIFKLATLPQNTATGRCALWTAGIWSLWRSCKWKGKRRWL